MKIDEHIKNLEKYCEDDIDFRSQTAEEEKSDFDIFCDNHIADIKAIIQELKNTQSDLYESNKRIADLLLILGDRDRMINKMAEQLAGITIWDIKKDEPLILMSEEEVIKYYEKESKNAKD